ncbi:hypothetical protein D7D52_12615 [Nocardia yunnanensis]|uniref:TY-Chap N-terminal domain-containing protein n=1 Tax=Nocardia yunnanensis TaxID=2382165 RepID=A0A386ZAG8_9NOCA|nr:DUF6301 family protein [Nocardia yunnanensis]AYF74568.1 hypothetical protein D7D52_12615 [Nocardia yunnanensis]
MGFEVRVDTAGAIEIVRAAAGFGWRWGSGNITEFSRLVGWTSPQPVGTLRDGPVFSRTGLSVWWDSAMFWGSERGLDYVRVTISDSPAPADFGSRELLETALARATAAFTEHWGEPEAAAAGPADGVAWHFANVFAGLTIGLDTVDLLLVNPMAQRYWMDRRHETARRRTAAGGWGRFAESLADFLETLPVDGRLVLTAPGGRFIQFEAGAEQLTGELARSEFIDPSWRYTPEIEQALIDQGWTPPRENNWTRAMSRRAGSVAMSGLALRIVDAWRTIGATATTELVADAWVEGGADLDLTSLGVPVHPTSRTQRAEFLRNHAAYDFDAGPLRVDVPAGIEIARAARAFDWTWTRADLPGFVAASGWKAVHDNDSGERVVWADTGLRVDDPRARFCFDGDRLEAVCVTLSDSIESFLYDEGLPAEVREQRTAAHARALDGFRAEFGMPRHGVLGQAHGPAWPDAKLTLGVITEVDTVELYLTPPGDRDRRLIIEQQRAAHRARDREWAQFHEELAGLVADLTETGQLTVDAGEPHRARIDRDHELLRLELASATARALSPRVLKFMLRDGWQHPDHRYPLWRIDVRLPTLPRDLRRLARLAVLPLRTLMPPQARLRVLLNGLDQPVRSPSTGAIGGGSAPMVEA